MILFFSLRQAKLSLIFTLLGIIGLLGTTMLMFWPLNGEAVMYGVTVAILIFLSCAFLLAFALYFKNRPGEKMFFRNKGLSLLMLALWSYLAHIILAALFYILMRILVGGAL